jgi:hypothetical protein
MRSEEERDREVAKRFFKLTGVVVGHTPGWVGTSRDDSYHLLCSQHYNFLSCSKNDLLLNFVETLLCNIHNSVQNITAISALQSLTLQQA